MRRSPITPQHMFPRTRNAIPPNILFSTTDGAPLNALRTLSATASSNATRPLPETVQQFPSPRAHRGSPRPAGCFHPLPRGTAQRRVLARQVEYRLQRAHLYDDAAIPQVATEERKDPRDLPPGERESRQHLRHVPSNFMLFAA